MLYSSVTRSVIIERRIVMLITFVTSVIKCFTEYELGNQFNEYLHPFGEGATIIDLFIILSYVIRIAVFLYVAVIFYQTLKYFIDLKILVLKS